MEIVQRIEMNAARFVTVKLAVALTGLTEPAIRNKMSDGTWLEGRQFRRRGSAVFIDMQGYEKWVDKGVA